MAVGRETKRKREEREEEERKEEKERRTKRMGENSTETDKAGTKWTETSAIKK